MKIFITGASGFLGGEFVRMAKGRHEIFAMSRTEISDRKIIAAGAMPVRGSLNDVTAKHIEGIDAVIHAAVSIEGKNKEEFWETNVIGTKRMLTAAREAKVKRFVHISSEAVLLHGQNLIGGVDETYPIAFNSPFPYSRTKAFAEKAVTDANDPANGFETISLRPRIVWGPGERNFTQAMKQMADGKKWVWFDKGRRKTSTCYVGNLAHAMELALTNGGPGQTYFILDGEPPIAFREWLPTITKVSGFDLKGPNIPGGVARFGALCTEKVCNAFNIHNTGLTMLRLGIAVLSRDCHLSDAKARQDLGYKPLYTRQQGLEQLRLSLVPSARNAGAPG